MKPTAQRYLYELVNPVLDNWVRGYIWADDIEEASTRGHQLARHQGPKWKLNYVGERPASTADDFTPQPNDA